MMIELISTFSHAIVFAFGTFIGYLIWGHQETE